MHIGAITLVLILSAMFITGLILWWTSPDELEGARQRERALEAMKKWSK